jgi:arsenate reductase
MEKKKRVLFFCKHNSCRSQIAEAYLKHMASEQFDVYSAGLSPELIHPLVDVVMQEDGIDIKGQASKSVDLYLGRQMFDWIIIVCREGEAECPRLFPFAIRNERWSLSDPAETEGDKDEVLMAYRRTRDEIKARVENWLAQNE